MYELFYGCKNWCCACKGACASGLEPKVSLYELRHTFVSVESSVLTDSQLKMLVGHSKNMDTSGVYHHELQGQREDLAAATTAAFRKAQG